MSFKTQDIIWEVPLADVQVGTAIGYEVELSQNSDFQQINYTLSTFREDAVQGVFFYSLDSGVTWVDFPIGGGGQTFDTSYMMKVVINVGEAGSIYVEKYGTVYKVSADGSEILDSYTIGSFNSTGFSIDRNNNLYVSGQNKTVYKISADGVLKDNKSINIRSNPLAVAVDSGRDFLWQIERRNIYLKDLRGSAISSVVLPFEIDVNDYSSSSSSSSSSSNSSSSNSSSSLSSNSSSSLSSDSSSSNSSSSMSSESSSSSSLQGCEPQYCAVDFTTVPSANGDYTWTGDYYNGKAVYTNGTLYLFFNGLQWAIFSDAPSGIPVTVYYATTITDCPEAAYSYIGPPVPEGNVYTGSCLVVSSMSSSSSDSSLSSLSSLSSSSNSSSSSSSSSSSIDTIYVCGEGIVPDCTGIYNLSGTYNGQNAYTDGTLWIWYESVTFPLKWYISATKGDGVESWRSDVSGVSGLLSLYSPTSGSSYLGNPTVQQTPCDEMSSSSSSSYSSSSSSSSYGYCASTIGAEGFTTYPLFNGTYDIQTSQYNDMPYWINENGKFLHYKTAPNYWALAETLGGTVRYRGLTPPPTCPYGNDCIQYARFPFVTSNFEGWLCNGEVSSSSSSSGSSSSSSSSSSIDSSSSSSSSSSSFVFVYYTDASFTYEGFNEPLASNTFNYAGIDGNGNPYYVTILGDFYLFADFLGDYGYNSWIIILNDWLNVVYEKVANPTVITGQYKTVPGGVAEGNITT